jgi:hypothetical protein
MNNIYYIYEHWRSDTGQCFYVGKGKNNRAYDLYHRKAYHKNTINYLLSNGFSVDVKIIDSELSEEESLLKEIELIAKWKSAGVKLANLTDGGDGVSGYKHTLETKEILKEKRKLQKTTPCSEETKEKIRKALIGKKKGKNPAHSERMKGKKKSEETKIKISIALTGSKRTDEQKKRISETLIGRFVSEETRLKLSLSHTGKIIPESIRAYMNADKIGKKRPQSVCDAVSAAMKGVPKKLSSIEKMKASMNSPEVLSKISGENHWRSKRRLEKCKLLTA